MPMVDTQLDELLHRLARVQPPPAPVISLYLNTQADERGRDRFSRFVQDELKDRVRGFRGHSGIKPSLERDVARIEEYLRTELRRETNGVRSEEHTSELQSHVKLVCRLLLGKK